MYSLLIILSVLCVSGKAFNNSSLCSFKKTDTTCRCYYKKEPYSEFPIYIADCIRMNFLEFPEDEELPNVQELDLSHNIITVLDTEKKNYKSKMLQILQLSYNSLTVIQQDFFATMPNLLHLDISHNNIASFPNANVFRGLSNLITLNLSSNGLSTLPDEIFLSVPNLKELDLSRNYLGALLMDLPQLVPSKLNLNPHIRILKLDGLGINHFKSEFFDKTEQLKYLSLSDNPMEEVPRVPYSLNYLDLSGTNISFLSGGYLNYHSLKVLKLNRLKKLHTIVRYTFIDLYSLEQLEINDASNLKELNEFIFGIPIERALPSLRRLSIARCGLETLNSTFLKLFKHVNTIDLRGNPWKCDCDLVWIGALNKSLIGGDQIR